MFWLGVICIVVALVVAIYTEVMAPMFDIFRGFLAGLTGGRYEELSLWDKHKFSVILGTIGLGMAFWFF